MKAIADDGDMVAGPWESEGRPWRRPAPRHRRRGASSWAEPCRARLESSGGAFVALLGTATAPQLVLDIAPNRHGPRLVDHVVDEADVIPLDPP